MTPVSFSATTAARPAVDSGVTTAQILGAQARRGKDFAATALRRAATAWFIVAVLGQLLFAFYVTVFYGRATLHGRFEEWNKVLYHGYVPGAGVHNAVLASHLLLAVVVMLGGALQLLPQLRRRWPVFHRWNGRVYVLATMFAAAGGLGMVLGGKQVGDLSQHVAVGLNALTIFTCASFAWGHAMARSFDGHRRWALRLFLVAGGVWFFRIGLMLWIVANHGPVGFDPKTFTGPFLTILSFAQFLLPLAIAQLCFHAQDRRSARGQLAMAGVLGAATLMTAGGVAAAAAIMWLPHL